ncbi:hypothetical protein VNI00_018780 [Paramarasmius palmivorus]
MIKCTTCYYVAYCNEACKQNDQVHHNSECRPPSSDKGIATRSYIMKHEQQLWKHARDTVDEAHREYQEGCVGHFLAKHAVTLRMRYFPSNGKKKSRSIVPLKETTHCFEKDFTCEELVWMIEVTSRFSGCAGVIFSNYVVEDVDGNVVYTVTKLWPYLV